MRGQSATDLRSIQTRLPYETIFIFWKLYESKHFGSIIRHRFPFKMASPHKFPLNFWFVQQVENIKWRQKRTNRFRNTVLRNIGLFEPIYYNNIFLFFFMKVLSPFFFFFYSFFVDCTQRNDFYVIQSRSFLALFDEISYQGVWLFMCASLSASLNIWFRIKK